MFVRSNGQAYQASSSSATHLGYRGSILNAARTPISTVVRTSASNELESLFVRFQQPFGLICTEACASALQTSDFMPPASGLFLGFGSSLPRLLEGFLADFQKQSRKHILGANCRRQHGRHHLRRFHLSLLAHGMNEYLSFKACVCSTIADSPLKTGFVLCLISFRCKSIKFQEGCLLGSPYSWYFQ